MAHRDEPSSPQALEPTTKASEQLHQRSAESMALAPASNDLNPIFDLLVGDSNDIEGLAAYALYKRHKRAWAADCRGNGREPSREEEKTFAKVASTTDQLDRYRKDAQDILIAFANEFVSDERANIVQEAMAGRAESAFTKIEGSGSFWSLVKVGVASTLITTIILAAIAYGVHTFGLDVVDALNNLPTTDSIEQGQ